mgnify:FL=1
MSDKSKKTHCILPYMHLYAEPTGLVKPCCIGGEFEDKLSLRDLSVEEAINSPQMKQLRKDMSEGIRNSVCMVCYEREDRGETSPRENFNINTLWKMPKVGKDFSVPKDALQHIDIRFSNLCNFKCRMCNHTFSSEWYKEIPLVENPHDDEIRTKEYYDYWKQNNPKKVIKAKEGIVEELKPFLPSVKSWYFAGGEPLITPEHSELLNYLHKTKPTIDIWGRQKKDVSIHYNTNLSILRFEKYNFLDIWFDFNKVFLSISCDGIGEIGEYQRTGFKTDVFIKNLKEIKKYFQPANSETQEVGYGYNFQYTTTIYNVFHIWDFYKFMLDEGYIEHERNIDFYYAWAPRRSALKYLPEADKPRVVEYLTDLLTKFKEPTTINKIESMIAFTKEQPDEHFLRYERDQLIKENARLDELRGGKQMKDINGMDWMKTYKAPIGSPIWKKQQELKGFKNFGDKKDNDGNPIYKPPIGSDGWKDEKDEKKLF